MRKLSDLSIPELEKRKKLLKGVLIGFGVLLLIFYIVFIVLIIDKELKPKMISGFVPAFIPMFTLPIVFLPIIITLNSVNKEIESRKSNE